MGSSTRDEAKQNIIGMISRPIFLTMIFLSSAAQADVPDSERAVLVSLYNSTNGAGWNRSDNWNSASPVCGSTNRWYGIVCDSNNSHVTGVFLYENNLSGSLPDISGLTNLSAFSVSMNQLTGALPSLASFSQLQILDVGYNAFMGAPPQPPSNTPQYSLTLCPNPLSKTPSTTWDALVGYSPWYRDCGGYPPSVTIVSAAPSPAMAGQPISVTMTVTSLLPQLIASVPTGNITVQGSTQSSGRCIVPGLPNMQNTCDSVQCTATLSVGTATCTLVFNQPGPHYFGATYLGDANYYSYSSASSTAIIIDPSSTNMAEAPLLDHWSIRLGLIAGLLGLVWRARIRAQ